RGASRAARSWPPRASAAGTHEDMHQPGAADTSMHRPCRHSIATGPFRHDFDQRMGIGTIRGMHEAVDADA
ncbi:hypothetical protein, partial [Burkholderia sp. Tr-20355]|uniref:hypothetical protein n=1 Tax=Burkholderia sp. Tr-20355 TaxID=2703895 RepID=UPI001980FFE8